MHAVPSSFSFSSLAATLVLATAATSAAAAADDGPFVLAYTDGQTAQSFASLQAHHAHLSAVGLGSTYALLANGEVDSSALTETTLNIIRHARSKGLPLYPTVSDYSNSYGGFDPAISNAVLQTAATRANAVENLVSLAVADDFAGINIDLEAVQPAMKSEMTEFIGALAVALHAQGRKLIISVPAKHGDSEPSYLDGYDYAALGAVVDYLQVMTYDEVGPGWSSSPSGTWPGPQAGRDWMETKLRYAVSRVPAAKVLQGLPTYGYDYGTGRQIYWKGSNGVPGYADIIAARNAKRQRDDAAATPFATWGAVEQQPDGTAWSTITQQPVLWYDDAQSISGKAALVRSYRLGGTSVWAMGYEDGTFWDAVAAGLRGTATGEVGRAGRGYLWSSNTVATSNLNRTAAPRVNDGDLGASVTLNSRGEGGAQRWQAAGIVFPAPRTISSAAFINGAIDQYANGYFESGLSLQYTIDGTTWRETGWAVTPAYPYDRAAAGKSYTFGGLAIKGAMGMRVSGRTGASSWSGAVKEVQLHGD